MGKQKSIVVGIIILIVVVLSILFFSGKSGDRAVVATVNGERITKGALNTKMAQIFGPDYGTNVENMSAGEKERFHQTQLQALDGLIDRTLVKQAAKAAGVVVSDKEVKEQLEELKKQFGGEKEFDSVMTEQGLTEKILLEQIREDLITSKYFLTLSTEQTSEDVITEEEMLEVYRQFTGSDENAPPFEEMRSNIEDYLKQQKQGLTGDLQIKSLRDSAKIEILI